MACSAGETCQNGQCVCSGTTTLCDGACIDTSTDALHCGSCTTPCGDGESCANGVCSCPAGNVVCGATCADLLSHHDNCGVCGNACGEIEECQTGVCRDTRPDGDDCGGAARSIDLSKVTLSQAVAVSLFEGAEAVSKNERTVDVIAGRDALVRAFVTPRSDFSPRELSFRVHIDDGSGSAPRVVHHKRMVSGPSSDGSLDSTFQVVVPGDVITSGSKYWVELVECNAPPSGEAGLVRLPESESIALEARQTGVVKIGFVPVIHDQRTPDTSPAALELYGNAILSQYPVVKVESFVTTAIQSGAAGIDFDLGEVLDRVREKRDDDGPADDIYYFGLIKPAQDFAHYCQGSCTTGVAFELDDTSQWSIASRAGIGIAFLDDVSAETLVHELGHNHGRPHAPCGVDAEAGFPHEGAKIGAWGYDMFEGSLKDPAKYVDFMSYCSPAWVSDFTYRALTERVAYVNEAPSAKRVGDPIAWSAIRVTERSVAWTRGITTHAGDAVPVEPGVVFDANGNELANVDVFRVRMSDGAGYVLFVPPARPGWFAVGLPGGPVLAY